MGDMGAYKAAADNDRIQIRTGLNPLVETLIFDAGTIVTLDGGKANDYVTTIGGTVFIGSMTIKSGRIIVNGITIR